MGPQKLSVFRVATVIAMTCKTGIPETNADCFTKAGSNANTVANGQDSVKISILRQHSSPIFKG